MRLHLLGINGPWAASDGATSGYLLEAGGCQIQLDMGAGVLARLTSVFPPEDLDALFLSHWHFDHASDLLTLMYRLDALNRTLPVYAPEDSASVIREIVCKSPRFDLHTLHAGEEVRLKDGVLVTACPARHPVPALGYRICAEERVLGYTGDTNTLPGLSDWYRGCELLLADGLFPSGEWNENKPHLSAALCAALARDAGVRRLVITHLNPSIPPEELLSEARPVFSRTELARAGAVLDL